MPRFWRFLLWLIGLCLVAFAMVGRVIEGPGELARIADVQTFQGQYPSLLFAVVTVSLLLFSEAADLGNERSERFWKGFAGASCLLSGTFLPIFAVWYGAAAETAANPANVATTLWVLAAIAALAVVAKLARLAV